MQSLQRNCYHGRFANDFRSMITEHPMTPQERRSVSSLALLYSFRMLGLFMVLPLLALYADDMAGVTPTTIGLALGIYGLGQALLQIPLGWLSDRIGRKPVIVVGLLVFALGSAVAAVADDIYGIIAGRALQGAGAIASTVMALAADLTREEQRTKAMASIGMSIGLAFALALMLGPVLATAGGLALVFWFTAALALAGVAIVTLLVPSPPRGLQHSEVGMRGAQLPSSLANPVLLRLSFGVFSLHFVLMACFLVVPQMLRDVAGLGRDDHWQVYLPALLLSIVGMVPLMILAERHGKLRAVFLVAIALVLAAFAAMLNTSVPLLLYLGMWLFFVGFNYLEATLPSLVSKAVMPGAKGTAMGVFSTSQFLGAFAGGAVGGGLLQYGGTPALMAACLALGGLWWLVSLPGFRIAVSQPGT